MELVARGIFKNVDCLGLLSARSVSPSWREAVDHARVWKIVLNKDVTIFFILDFCIAPNVFKISRLNGK